MKKILFISRQAPYGSSRTREALDAVLATAAYDQDLSFLFMDDGVFQLLKNQNTQDIQQKNISAQLKALDLYDVQKLYVAEDSLINRGIEKHQLIIEKLAVLSVDEIKLLFAAQDQILSF